ncbi:MAG: ABC transporter permease [Clostridiales bacterium]|nr:ABC transporter permease [Clostridiales bacterium]
MTRRRIAVPRQLYLLIVLAVIATVFGIGSPKYLTAGNISNIIANNFEIGLVAVAMTLVILMGGMDMSVGSIVALSSILTGTLNITLGLSLSASILLALCAGILIGALNGALVIWLENANPMIITIGTMVLFSALATLITEGWTISGFEKAFEAFSYSRILGVKGTIILLIALIAAGQWMLTHTMFGNFLYAMGNNEKSAYFAGVRVKRIKFLIYVVSGFTAALAGVFLTSRMQTSYPDAGSGYHMEAIACIVIGGASISGGEGNLIGTFIGFLIIAALKNGMSLMGISSLTQMVFTGIVLIFTIWVNNAIRERELRRSLLAVKENITR